MAMISKRSVNAFLKRKGIDPTELWAGKGPAVKVGRKEARKIAERLAGDKVVVLRMVNDGTRFEFVNLKFVKIAPRYHYERKKSAQAAKAITKTGRQTLPGYTLPGAQ